MIFGAFGGHGVVFFFFWGHLFEGLSGSFFDFGELILEALGVILGAFGGHFGDLGGSLGDFLDVFTRMQKKRGLAQLAASTFGAPSTPNGANMGPQIAPNLIPNWP